jgi:Fe-S oxidoreductase
MNKKTKDALQLIMKKRQAYNCIECGKCSAVCPVGVLNEKYYPRIILRKALHESPDVLEDGLLWSCLNCGRCDEVCELDVKFYDFIKDLRAEVHRLGLEGVIPPHNGGLHAWMALMKSGTLKQNRLDWINGGLKHAEHGDVLYFVGCLPYYDRFFQELKPDTLKIARSTLKILNALNVDPVIMKNERCCGHDFLWGGDVASFKKLAQINLKEIMRSGAKEVVTACAECYHTLNSEYPEHFGELEFKVHHISEFIAEKMPNLRFKKLEKQVTYQDPCRLGRLSGLFEEPREVMTTLPGIEFRDMDRNRKRAVCCGTSGWLSCGTYSKQIQISRLKEAGTTGADTLVTACPKCQIHFKCAQADPNTDDAARIDILDLTTLIENAME